MAYCRHIRPSQIKCCEFTPTTKYTHPTPMRWHQRLRVTQWSNTFLLLQPHLDEHLLHSPSWDITAGANGNLGPPATWRAIEPSTHTYTSYKFGLSVSTQAQAEHIWYKNWRGHPFACQYSFAQLDAIIALGQNGLA